jgi:hypothetical protein
MRQALLALYRALLHEHHDFFFSAMQHPYASSTLWRIASNHSTLARMWKYGIHCFLELLRFRFRLPDFSEFMNSIICTVYQMMFIIYETVPASEDMIDDENFSRRKTWAGIPRFWYLKTADRLADVGRLYHHLAILGRPNALKQLCLCCRSLNLVQMFTTTFVIPGYVGTIRITSDIPKAARHRGQIDVCKLKRWWSLNVST